MIDLSIPGFGKLSLRRLVLDYNGTLALDGALLEGVSPRLRLLARRLDIITLTADTFGTARRELEGLPCRITTIGRDAMACDANASLNTVSADTTSANNASRANHRPESIFPENIRPEGIQPANTRPATIREDEAKLLALRDIGAAEAAYVGNGANDAAALAEAALGICVIQAECASPKSLVAADVAASHITHALDLLLHPKRLLATLRT